MDNSTNNCLIGSLNVRGINGKVKRNAIFEWVRKKNLDVVMLQECYCIPETNQAWADEWGGECHFANGTKHSCGTVIMFRKGLDVNVLDCKIDIGGRYVMLKVQIEGEELCLINLYGPTKH